VVFRFPRRRFSAALIEREIAVLPRIAPLLPLAISDPLYAGVSTQAYPCTFAGYAQIAGTTACSFPLDDVMRASLAQPLGAFLRALHAIDPQPFIERGLPYDEIARLDHTKRHPQTLERVAFLSAAGIGDLESHVEWLAAHPPVAADAGDRRIVHGDLYARHVIVDANGRATGVIDWGDVHCGDRALDLAIAFLLLPPDAHASFREAYGTIDDRTWNAARYRATYHAILEREYGLRVGDARMQSAGATALAFIRSLG
jgi:aminoglycoside phosphotransferase (APT) family kinase protein